MFDIGFWELGVIFVVALLVVGPEKMPDEYKQLNKDFLEEDRKLKDLAREPTVDDVLDLEKSDETSRQDIAPKV